LNFSMQGRATEVASGSLLDRIGSWYSDTNYTWSY
jgi:hypothetical protein